MPTDQSTTADYMEWVEAVNYSPPSVVNQTISLWCVEENIFYDIHMESWTTGNNGGGFSYWRTPVEPPLGPSMLLVWTGEGSDSTGDGSFESPYATIGHAFSEMNSGDIVLVGQASIMRISVLIICQDQCLVLLVQTQRSLMVMDKELSLRYTRRLVSEWFYLYEWIC